jgi:hypothetical protein
MIPQKASLLQPSNSRPSPYTCHCTWLSGEERACALPPNESRSNPRFPLLFDCRSGSLPTETKVECGKSRSKSGTSFNLWKSGSLTSCAMPHLPSLAASLSLVSLPPLSRRPPPPGDPGGGGQPNGGGRGGGGGVGGCGCGFGVLG